jgi:adenylosuccinate synthase
MINGFTALCLTKLDTLDELSEIKVATTYKRNGVELPNFPGKKKLQIIFFLFLYFFSC